MADRRMFSKVIIDSDAFLEMPLSTQALYFHLSMRADDDGFVGNPKRIRSMVGASEDDLRLLIAKRYILTFESGVIVIKHWKIHNYIQNDRYKGTTYVEEKSTLSLDEKKAYIEGGYILDTQVSIGKVSIGKVSIDLIDENFEELWKMLKSTPYDRKQQVKPKRKKELYEMGAERTRKAIEIYIKTKDEKINYAKHNFLNEVINNYLDKEESDFQSAKEKPRHGNFDAEEVFKRKITETYGG